MTDIETLITYRMNQARESLTDAQRMVEGNFSPRSIVNRAYYSMFYSILALFLKAGLAIKTSKHIGVITIFDKEFVHSGKVDKHYSSILHKIFDARLKSDYKEMVDITIEEARDYVNKSKEFIAIIENLINLTTL